MWTSLRHDWNGFLGFVQAEFPEMEPDEAPAHSEGWRAFVTHLGRVADLTPSEAEEIFANFVLPRWFDRRLAMAAE